MSSTWSESESESESEMSESGESGESGVFDVVKMMDMVVDLGTSPPDDLAAARHATLVSSEILTTIDYDAVPVEMQNEIQQMQASYRAFTSVLNLHAEIARLKQQVEHYRVRYRKYKKGYRQWVRYAIRHTD